MEEIEYIEPITINKFLQQNINNNPNNYNNLIQMFNKYWTIGH
jgi:hypothetical protein